MKSMEVVEEKKFKPVALVFETQEECNIFSAMMFYDITTFERMRGVHNYEVVKCFMREVCDVLYIVLEKQRVG